MLPRQPPLLCCVQVSCGTLLLHAAGCCWLPGLERLPFCTSWGKGSQAGSQDLFLLCCGVPGFCAGDCSSDSANVIYHSLPGSTNGDDCTTVIIHAASLMQKPSSECDKGAQHALQHFSVLLGLLSTSWYTIYSHNSC
jgi:hypothetical protein